MQNKCGFIRFSDIPPSTATIFQIKCGSKLLHDADFRQRWGGILKEDKIVGFVIQENQIILKNVVNERNRSFIKIE